MTQTDKKIRILIVEDDMIDRLQVSRAIEKTGLDIDMEEALTLTQAREALRMSDYDVVILDNHLPDGFGAQLADEMVKTGLGRGARIIMLTGDPSVIARMSAEPLEGRSVLDKDEFSARRLREILQGGAGHAPLPNASSEECTKMFMLLAEENLPEALDTLEAVYQDVWGRVSGTSP